MKSQHLHTKSMNSTFSSRRARKGFAAIFAAALAMGLSVGSLLAQGPYYPQVNPLGGATFEPNGKPVITDLNLNAIEAKLAILFPTKSLIIPAPAGKFTASQAEYAAAVKALATDVANGTGPVGITTATLAAAVVKYREVQIPAALEALAEGVIASSSGTKASQLAAAVQSAAAARPVTLELNHFNDTMHRAAADNALVASVKDLVVAAIQGAAGASGLTPAGVKGVTANAIAAIGAAPAGNPATMTTALKKALAEGVATTVIPSVNLNSPNGISQANLDHAAFGLTPVAAHVDLEDMVAKIRLAIGVVTANQAGAIALGALRNTGNRTPAGYTDIKAGLAANAYSDDLVDAFAGYTNALTATTTGLVGSFDPAAVAAAGSLKFVASAHLIVKDVLIAAAPGAGAVAENIVARATAAAQNQTATVSIATTNAAGFGGAAPADIVAGVIKGGQVQHSGLAAKAVASNVGNLNVTQAPLIAAAAIKAAAAVSSASNKSDAYADIANNIGVALKSPSPLDNPRRVAAVTAMVQEIVTAGTNAPNVSNPTYIAVIGAMAGNGSVNAAAIATAGLTADGASNGGLNAGAINAGTSLATTLLTAGASNPTANYHTVRDALAANTTDEENRARLYAASLANSNDAAGALALSIKNTTTSVSVLTKDAISANRTKSLGLTISASIADHIKTNGISLVDIQAFIGRQVLANPANLADIATAATVSAPAFSHHTAHAIAFNSPKTVSLAVPALLQHSLFTNTTGAGLTDKLNLGSRPAAVAALTAAMATGIMESRDLSVNDRKIALRDYVEVAVVTIKNTVPVLSAYDAQPGSPADDLSFVTYKAGGGTTTQPAKGVAGAVTGFVAQLAKPDPGSGAVNLADQNYVDIMTALQSISGAVGPSGFKIDIAQAAAQAIGWVFGSAPTNSAAVASAIQTAIQAGFPGGTSAADVLAAAQFGFAQAALFIPGAGAAGLRNSQADPYYSHKSASGLPVSNILSL